MKFLCLALFLFVSCEKIQEPVVTATPPPESQAAAVATAPAMAPSINVANVIVETAAGEKTTLTAEVAATPDERRVGLMHRENLAEGHGMWFLFPEDVQDPFWMKDTLVSLDIIFVDSDKKVVDFFENTIPNSESLLTPRKPYRTVLEVSAGFVKKHQLQSGDILSLQVGPN